MELALKSCWLFSGICLQSLRSAPIEFLVYSDLLSVIRLGTHPSCLPISLSTHHGPRRGARL